MAILSISFTFPRPGRTVPIFNILVSTVNNILSPLEKVHSLRETMRSRSPPFKGRGAAPHGISPLLPYSGLFQVDSYIQVSHVMEYQCTNGLKGQQAHSPRQRPGYQQMPTFALKGQKHNRDESPTCSAFALSGRDCHHRPTQGAALGYGLIAPSGRTQLNLRKLNKYI